MTRSRLTLEPISGIAEARPGDEPARLIAQALSASGKELGPGSVLVVAQKLISKCEGRLVRLQSVEPSARAEEIARTTLQPPELVELVLRESVAVLRVAPHALIVETHHGLVCANAGVDRSNVPDGWVALLPLDSDASAGRLRRGLAEILGVEFAVVVADTFGRAWREGLVNVAIGVDGMAPIRDYRGLPDAGGRVLEGTVVAEADELAAAAELLMGKSDNVPAVLVHGFRPAGQGNSAQLLRDRSRDLFREAR